MSRYRVKLTVHDDQTGKAVAEEDEADCKSMSWYKVILMFNSAFDRLKGSDAETP